MALPVIGGVVAALTGGAALRAGIAWFIFNVAGQLIYRTMFALGIGLIAYSGIDIVLDPVANEIQSRMGNLPINIQSALARMRVDEAIGILFAALTYVTVLRFSRTSIGYLGRGRAGARGGF